MFITAGKPLDGSASFYLKFAQASQYLLSSNKAKFQSYFQMPDWEITRKSWVYSYYYFLMHLLALFLL